jgi:hypothetical protein
VPAHMLTQPLVLVQLLLAQPFYLH